MVHTLVSDVTRITLRTHSRMLLALHSYFDGISYGKKFLLRPLFLKKKNKKRNVRSALDLSDTATVSGNTITNQK